MYSFGVTGWLPCLSSFVSRLQEHICILRHFSCFRKIWVGQAQKWLHSWLNTPKEENMFIKATPLYGRKQRFWEIVVGKKTDKSSQTHQSQQMICQTGKNAVDKRDVRATGTTNISVPNCVARCTRWCWTSIHSCRMRQCRNMEAERVWPSSILSLYSQGSIPELLFKTSPFF